MANPTRIGRRITADDVVSKLKDDGDFDKLRLKIVRKLKDNVDLRSSIISVIKQSAALNQPGAENMKPSQLCDAVHEEIRENAMKQISDSLWEIIRSADGMQTEITETVHSVHHKLINPQVEGEAVSATSTGQVPKQREAVVNGLVKVSAKTEVLSPGVDHAEGNNFQTELSQPVSCQGRVSDEEEELRPPREASEMEDGDPSIPPGFDSLGKSILPDGSDEDPDVPPGFG